MPVLEREEYVEQAYFFNSFRERLVDGLPGRRSSHGSARNSSRPPSFPWPFRSSTPRSRAPA